MIASVTGQEITSERSIALVLAALKSDHIPAAPVRCDLHAVATESAERALEPVGGANHRVGVAGRPGLHDRRVAIGGDRDARPRRNHRADRADRPRASARPRQPSTGRPGRRPSWSASGRPSSGHSSRALGSSGRSAGAPAPTASRLVSQPAPESAVSTRGARKPSATATITQRDQHGRESASPYSDRACPIGPTEVIGTGRSCARSRVDDRAQPKARLRISEAGQAPTST